MYKFYFLLKIDHAQKLGFARLVKADIIKRENVFPGFIELRLAEISNALGTHISNVFRGVHAKEEADARFGKTKQFIDDFELLFSKEENFNENTVLPFRGQIENRYQGAVQRIERHQNKPKPSRVEHEEERRKIRRERGDMRRGFGAAEEERKISVASYFRKIKP